MMKNRFKQVALVVLAGTVLLGACGKSDSDSPDFAPGTVLKISGKYLDENGEPFSDRAVMFRNTREFAYIDESSVALESALRTFGSMVMYAAFPFFFFYDNIFGQDPTKVDRSKYEEKANYQLASARTDGTGAFTFEVEADDMLRDSDGGINIVVVNEKADAPLFGKYAFVVKKEDTTLESLPLCTLGGIQFSENAATDQITFTWTAPSKTVSKYILRFGLPENGAMVWSEVVDGASATPTTATFSRAIFQGQPMRLAIEAFYTFSSTKKYSCLTSPLDFTATTIATPVSTGALASTDNIKFKINSLTNGGFTDNMYFGAFDPRDLTLDLGEEKTFSRMVFHNLKLRTGGNVKVSTSSDGVTFSDSETFEEKRFIDHSFAALSARYVKLTFSSRIVDLQELTLY
jgi:hypothetical protein